MIPNLAILQSKNAKNIIVKCSLQGTDNLTIRYVHKDQLFWQSQYTVLLKRCVIARIDVLQQYLATVNMKFTDFLTNLGLSER